MQDRGLGGFSLGNIRGTSLAVLILILLAVLGLFTLGVSFRGTVIV